MIVSIARIFGCFTFKKKKLETKRNSLGKKWSVGLESAASPSSFQKFNLNIHIYILSSNHIHQVSVFSHILLQKVKLLKPDNFIQI